MKAVYLGKQNIGSNIYTFSFQPEKNLNYLPGQFTELYLPHNSSDKRGQKRWFTISTSPTEENITITTRFDSLASSSFKSALVNLQPGIKASLASPMGDFILPKDPSIPLVFASVGIGCTPFRSITKYLQDTGQSRDIVMIQSSRSESEAVFSEIFEHFGENYHKVIGEKLTGQTIINIAGETNDRRYVYISGPEPAIEDLQKQLVDLGINKKFIYTDFFQGYTDI